MSYSSLENTSLVTLPTSGIQSTYIALDHKNGKRSPYPFVFRVWERSLHVHTIHTIRVVEETGSSTGDFNACVWSFLLLKPASPEWIPPDRGTLGARSWLFSSRGWDREYKAKKKKNKKRRRKREMKWSKTSL